jgi:phosphoadenosine phosphosulfate reductase
MKRKTAQLNAQFKNSTAQEVLTYMLQGHHGKVALSSSFGAEDQVLTDMMLTIDPAADIFTLDTGLLPLETYYVMGMTNLKYGVTVTTYTPEFDDVQKLYREQGVDGFYESVANRKACCYVRKIAPLKRALKDVGIWVTGLRAEQSVTREGMRLFEFDEGNKVIKLNPLIKWSTQEVWDYIKANGVPYNELHDLGYPSIGCAPCTRAVEEGGDIRSGRWWWENPEHKECGLHLK